MKDSRKASLFRNLSLAWLWVKFKNKISMLGRINLSREQGQHGQQKAVTGLGQGLGVFGRASCRWRALKGSRIGMGG